jgi:hypothetical protein
MKKGRTLVLFAMPLFAVCLAMPGSAQACNVQLGFPNSCNQHCDGDFIDGPEVISCADYIRRKRESAGSASRPRDNGGRINPQQIQTTKDTINPQQIQTIKDTAAAICNTVKEARGQKDDLQIAGDVQLKLNGLIGKVIDVGGSGKGSLSREEFNGLSREATATALEGDRGCRERLFNKMFDKLGWLTRESRFQVSQKLLRGRMLKIGDVSS